MADFLIHCATSMEMAFFLKQYPPDSEEKLKAGFKIIRGRIKKISYDLILSGPGVFNTVQAITSILEKKSYPLILQTGIAGLFEQTTQKIGDVAVATWDRYLHTGIQSDSQELLPLPFDLVPCMPETKAGKYGFDENLINKGFCLLYDAFGGTDTDVLKGGFVTVSSISGSKELADTRFSLFSPVMEAMEGAACAHAAARYQIPIIEVRSASNFTGDRDKTTWDIDKASQRIATICEAICGLL